MAAFIKNILLGTQYTGIELFSENNQDRIAMLTVKKKKNEIVITDKNIFDNYNDAQIQNTKQPVVLIINNTHVLQKEVEGTDGNEKKILHKAYPNIKIEDFYYEIWNNGNNTIVSLCRKAYIEALLTDLKSKFRIYKISLGTSAIAQITEFTNIPALSTNTQIINLTGENFVITSNNNKYIQEEYLVNGLHVSNNHILGFSGILKLLFDDNSHGNIDELNAAVSDNYNQQALFEKAVTAGIILVLGILLVNLFAFSFFYGKSNEMTEAASLDKTYTKTIIRTKKQIQDKEARLKNFTSSGASKSSLLINDIVKNIPHSILLTEISYHPVEKKIKEDEYIISQDNTIMAAGNVLSNTDFTNWIEHLQKLQGISYVTITQFGKDTDGKSVFTIKITTSHETE